MMVQTYQRNLQPEIEGPSYERVYHTHGTSFYGLCEFGSAGRARELPGPVWSDPRRSAHCAEDRQALADRQALRCLYQQAFRWTWAGRNHHLSQSRSDLAGGVRAQQMCRAVGGARHAECLHGRECDPNGASDEYDLPKAESGLSA